MFDSDIEKTIIVTAVILWFAHGWYLNVKQELLNKKIDRLFDGLQKYLYEIDPQFDDERAIIGSPIDSINLREKKKQQGKRTLITSFIDE